MCWGTHVHARKTFFFGETTKLVKIENSLI